MTFIDRDLNEQRSNPCRCGGEGEENSKSEALEMGMALACLKEWYIVVGVSLLERILRNEVKYPQARSNSA